MAGADDPSASPKAGHIIAQPTMLQWEAEALAETWREVGHEAELAACGDITADYRIL